jgi:hypothetical protein
MIIFMDKDASVDGCSAGEIGGKRTQRTLTRQTRLKTWNTTVTRWVTPSMDDDYTDSGVQLSIYDRWFFWADTDNMRLTLVCRRCGSWVDGNAKMRSRHLRACLPEAS